MEYPLFRTQYNYHPDITEIGESNPDPSMTVPDQSLSIKDILYRFAKGLPLDDLRTSAQYGDDIDNSDDDFSVHPSNTFNHDLLDLLPDDELTFRAVTSEPSNAQTTINDDKGADGSQVQQEN